VYTSRPKTALKQWAATAGLRMMNFLKKGLKKLNLKKRCRFGKFPKRGIDDAEHQHPPTISDTYPLYRDQAQRGVVRLSQLQLLNLFLK
jgi:hypothetical protein